MAGNIVSQVSGLVEKACDEFGVLLYDIEFIKEGKNQVLRIYIDKEPGGVFLDDCETLSRTVSELLDQSEILDIAYTLEVSSPGVERKLKQDWHYEKAIGKDIVVSLYSPFNNQKTLTGSLVSYGDTLVLACGKETVELEKSKISSARLYFDINAALKNAKVTETLD